MPLRQSTLKFGFHSATSLAALPPDHADSVPAASTASFTSSADADTIVVDTTDFIHQLPTPSESATDVSSESSQTVTSKVATRLRSKGVTSTKARKSVFEEDLTAEIDGDQEKSRSVSGETLVAQEAALSQSSPVQQGIKALDLSWNMSSIFTNGSKADLVDEQEEEKTPEEEVSSVITVADEEGDDPAREERLAARRATMEANAKRWEERKKAAEKSATRRSGRASLMTKASELFDNVKKTVLGKRTRATEAAAQQSTKSRRDISSVSTAQGSASKKRKIDELETVVEEPAPIKYTTRREKRWLGTGLYAGQPRAFDARSNEKNSSHKRKSATTEEIQTKDNTVMPLPMFAGDRLLQHGRDFKLPFDIFSPLPAGQPKPDEWKKVNKNVFVGDAAAEWRTNKFVEHSTCLCKASTGCDQDCMNRYMYYECDEHNCNLKAEQCGNRAFEGLKQRSKIGGKFNVGVEVIKTADRGYGVRSNRSFMPNQVIVEYTGEIITQEECEQRMRTIYKDNECYYLMLFDQNMIIDATRGSIARFVNHSCDPNCRMEKWTVGGKPRMALFAGDRGIMTGEELTYDYNFDPYSQKNVQVCRCGAETCRGVLGPKPKPEAKRSSPEEESKKKKEGKLSGAKRKVAEVLEESSNRLSKKRKIGPLSKKTSKSPTKKSLAKGRTDSRKPKKAILVKKTAARRVAMPKTTKKSSKTDSKLKKIIADTKKKTGSITKRVASSTSATETLLKKDKTSVSRSSSLKEKAKTVVQSVRGRRSTVKAVS